MGSLRQCYYSHNFPTVPQMLVTGSTFHARSSEVLFFGVTANRLFVFYESNEAYGKQNSHWK